jgi:hypothetical protein
MMHSFRELYTLYNHPSKVRYATAAFLKANNIPIDDACDISLRNKGKVCADYASYTVSHIKGVKVLDVTGIKLVYMYGEKTWFDDETERDEYRAKMMIERALEAERNKVKNAVIAKLDKMSKADLEKLLEIL